jgi:hypothetical protein
MRHLQQQRRPQSAEKSGRCVAERGSGAFGAAAGFRLLRFSLLRRRSSGFRKQQSPPLLLRPAGAPAERRNASIGGTSQIGSRRG